MRGLFRGVLLAVLLAACFAIGTAHGAPPAKTAVTMYEAFTSSGQIVPQVTYRSGYCVGGSYASARHDAFRCDSVNEIYDPCFSSSHRADIVVCPKFVEAGPSERGTGVAIRLTKPLDDPNPQHLRLQPLVIETSTGDYFEFALGATTSAFFERHSVRLNYLDYPTDVAALWGFPDRTGRLWTIPETRGRAVTVLRLKPSDRVTVRHVWF